LLCSLEWLFLPSKLGYLHNHTISLSQPYLPLKGKFSSFQSSSLPYHKAIYCSILHLHPSLLGLVYQVSPHPSVNHQDQEDLEIHTSVFSIHSIQLLPSPSAIMDSLLVRKESLVSCQKPHCPFLTEVSSNSFLCWPVSHSVVWVFGHI